MAESNRAVRACNSLCAGGAHRGTALHPIRPTINSWDSWASGEFDSGGRRARTANRLSIQGVERVSRVSPGRDAAQVARSPAQRERESCAPFNRWFLGERQQFLWQSCQYIGFYSEYYIHNNDQLSRAFSSHTFHSQVAIGTRSRGRQRGGSRIGQDESQARATAAVG